MPRTVQLSEEAYVTLAALKQPGESFSDVVRRLAAAQKDPLRLLRLQRRPRMPGEAQWRERMREADRARAEALRRPGRARRKPGD